MIKSVIQQLVDKEDLDIKTMQSVIRLMMQGESNDAEIAGFLTALAIKGETVEEIYAAATVMRELSTKIEVSDNSNLVDPVGTGGTKSRVFNVSTASAIVAACAGVNIAKHGNRASSSKSGSADLLDAAGVNLNLNPDQLKRCIEEFGIGFMFAPNHHSAMKYVVPARTALGIRTIFNLLGPLTNPCGAKRQVLGVYSREWLRPLVDVSQRLGQISVVAINSDDGLDEISIVEKTNTIFMDNGNIKEFTINPKEYNINHKDLEAVRVNSAAESLALIREAFSGKKTPAYDMIALNAGAIIRVAVKVDEYDDAFAIAKDILDSGEANAKLDAYAKFTQNI